MPGRAALPEVAFVSVASTAALQEILCRHEDHVVGRNNTVYAPTQYMRRCTGWPENRDGLTAVLLNTIISNRND